MQGVEQKYCRKYQLTWICSTDCCPLCQQLNNCRSMCCQLLPNESRSVTQCVDDYRPKCLRLSPNASLTTVIQCVDDSHRFCWLLSIVSTAIVCVDCRLVSTVVHCVDCCSLCGLSSIVSNVVRCVDQLWSVVLTVVCFVECFRLCRPILVHFCQLSFVVSTVISYVNYHLWSQLFGFWLPWPVVSFMDCLVLWWKLSEVLNCSCIVMHMFHHLWPWLTLKYSSAKKYLKLKNLPLLGSFNQFWPMNELITQKRYIYTFTILEWV